MSEENKKTTRTISRREFLRDAGIVVGGTAVSSAFFLSACGEEVEVTKTVTTTAPGSTITTTQAGITKTQTKYICPVCNQEFDSLNDLKEHYDSEHEGQVVSTTDVINITVNGYKHILRVEPAMTLQELLREELGITSIKDMCYGYGACGSCSVIKDGRPILSCMVLAIDCDGVAIETAEGIADANHPIIDGFIDSYAIQCGYCTPGFIVTAKALLDRKPDPSEDEIRDALGGNICRCATYNRLIPAVTSASKELGGG